MTIHLAYAIPRPRPRVGLGTALAQYERARLRVPFLPHWYRRGWLPLVSRPLFSPFSITWNLLRFLKQYAPVRLYDFQTQEDIPYGPDDIVLGHPDAVPGTVMQRVLANPKPCRLKALLVPLSHGLSGPEHYATPESNRYAVPMIERADAVLGIMGPYWYDTLGTSFLAPFASKITRVDMAIDVQQYPRVKTQFNSPGQRGFLYIGSNRPGKGADVMAATMKRLPAEMRRGWVGIGADIPHVPRLAPYGPLSPALMATLAREYDVFVNMSTSDPNPTTILEAMAWGLPVACTPQSGYADPAMAVPLSTTDLDFNVRQLTALQYAPDAELHARADRNRKLVETHYTWDRFCKTVWNVLKPFVDGP